MSPDIDGLESRARSDDHELIPLTTIACLDASTIDGNHHDPFDRMIAAVARLESLPPISSDPAFDEIGIKGYRTT